MIIKHGSGRLKLNPLLGNAEKLYLTAFLILMGAGTAKAGMCVVQPVNPVPTSLKSLPLVVADQFSFKGAFTIPAKQYGESNSNFAEAVIEQSGDSLYMVGFVRDDAIAEFRIPELVNSTRIADLNSTGAPIQSYSRVLDRTTGGNLQAIDQIMGMEVYKGRLIVNALEYYDAPGDNTHTTVVLSDASNLAGSTVEGFLELPGAARSGGWIEQVPTEWQEALGGDLLTGNSSGTSIVLRHSVGPSAHALNGDAFLAASAGNPAIGTNKLLEYSLDNRLRDDLYNVSLTNDAWTMTTQAKYGFIVPGTRTYATFGYSSGHVSGLGYKIEQWSGKICGGPCPYDPTDWQNFYWFFDMNDLLAVKAGTLNSYDVEPYAYGEFDVPFQTSGSGFNQIAGGAYDLATNTLYLSVYRANNTIGQYDNPPVIAAFSIDPK